MIQIDTRNTGVGGVSGAMEKKGCIRVNTCSCREMGWDLCMVVCGLSVVVGGLLEDRSRSTLCALLLRFNNAGIHASSSLALVRHGHRFGGRRGGNPLPRRF